MLSSTCCCFGGGSGNFCCCGWCASPSSHTEESGRCSSCRSCGDRRSGVPPGGTTSDPKEDCPRGACQEPPIAVEGVAVVFPTPLPTLQRAMKKQATRWEGVAGFLVLVARYGGVSRCPALWERGRCTNSQRLAHEEEGRSVQKGLDCRFGVLCDLPLVYRWDHVGGNNNYWSRRFNGKPYLIVKHAVLDPLPTYIPRRQRR